MSNVNINKDKCKGCELCKNVCPQGIISMSDKISVKGYYPAQVVEPTRCIVCRLCAITCPDVAIEVEAEGSLYKFFDY